MFKLGLCRGLMGRIDGTLLTHVIHSPCRNWKGTLKLNTGLRSAGKSNFPQGGHPGLHISGQRCMGVCREGERGITFTLSTMIDFPQSGKFDQIDCFPSMKDTQMP